MAGRDASSQQNIEATMESIMQRASLLVSLAALGLMIGGLIDVLGSGISLTQATVALPPSALLHPTQAPPGIMAMSAGIVLLALLPSVRVVLALWFAVRRRHLGDIVVALLVLLELLLSMRGED
jgi:uncharacterized membrane protein